MSGRVNKAQPKRKAWRRNQKLGSEPKLDD